MVTAQQIQDKFKYLRDIFVKTDIKVNNNEDLTYFEKCIYQRMFFLKPDITHKEYETELSKYECMSSIKVNETMFDASTNEIMSYLTNVKENEVIQSKVEVLNDIIKSYDSSETQRLCLLFILKKIRNFRSNKSIGN